MGVVNVTPDSFSDGGRWLNADAAASHADDLVAEGAKIVDVGGESTRPGAEPVDADTEAARVVPVIERIAATHTGVEVSVDTTKLAVAERAVAAGATFVNDVTAFRHDPGMAEFVSARGLRCCLMHMQGDPRTMQQDPRYGDVVEEVRAFLSERAQAAIDAGVAPANIQLDPGIGFGKTLSHNLELLRRLDELVALGFPVVVGASRKSFIGMITGAQAHDRVAGTIAANVMALERGASVFRVHDVAEARQALAVAAAVLGA
jgi:dihydropteroate synthase